MVGGGCVAVRAGDWNNHAAAVTMIGGCMYFVFVCVCVLWLRLKRVEVFRLMV